MFFNSPLILIALFSCTTISSLHTLDESLEYGTINDYNYYHFQFTQKLREEDGSHGFGFPRSIIQILQQSPFKKEIKLSFRKGRWPKDSNGMDLSNHLKDGIRSQGVEFEASSFNTTTTTKDFLYLADCLSGLFCSSLSTISDISHYSTKNYQTFNAILANEAVCTENLTPWIRLLPPGTPSPLKSLLPKGDFLFSQPFHQLDLSISLIMDDKEDVDDDRKASILLHQNLLFLSKEHFPLNENTKSPQMPHPYLKSSSIERVLEPINSIEPITIDTKILGSSLALGTFVMRIAVCPLRWEKDDEGGALSIEIEQILPFYMMIFISEIILPSNVQLKYRPGDSSTKSPTQINLLIRRADFEEDEIVTLKIPFKRLLLSTTEYPFDPARGFDIPPPRIFGGANGRGKKILLPLPTPDFTMPYNVITLTTTIIVLFYGTMFNLIYRSFYSKPLEEQNVPLKN